MGAALGDRASGEPGGERDVVLDQPSHGRLQRAIRNERPGHLACLHVVYPGRRFGPRAESALVGGSVVGGQVPNAVANGAGLEQVFLYAGYTSSMRDGECVAMPSAEERGQGENPRSRSAERRGWSSADPLMSRRSVSATAVRSPVKRPAYVLRVILESACPSMRATATTSAPARIARDAAVC